MVEKYLQLDQDLSTAATKICHSVQQDLLRPGYDFALVGQQGFVVDRDRAVATRAKTVQASRGRKGSKRGAK